MKINIDKCRIRPTQHAKTKMIDQGIGKEKIKEIIRFGMKRPQREKIIAKMQNIEIVFKAFPCNIKIITLYPLSRET